MCVIVVWLGIYIYNIINRIMKKNYQRKGAKLEDIVCGKCSQQISYQLLEGVDKKLAESLGQRDAMAFK